MLDISRLLQLAGINESYQIDEAREDEAAKNSEAIMQAYAADEVPGALQADNALDFVKKVSNFLGMPANKSIVRVMQWYANQQFKLADLEQLKERLVAFEKPVVKNALVAAGKSNSVMNYPVYNGDDGFAAAVDAVVAQDLKSGKQQKAEAKLEGAEYYNGFNTGAFRVILPKTEKASQLYGGGTSWCTAYTDKPCKFNEYIAQGKIYIIFTPATGPNDKFARGGYRKYQIHMENNEFKDSFNENLTQEHIHYLSGIPEYRKFLEALIHDYYEK